jgi:hypothetical protein
MDIVELIIEYELGELNAQEILDLFSKLVKSGMAWTLQGHYGRVANALIERGYLSKDGTILKTESED